MTIRECIGWWAYVEPVQVFDRERMTGSQPPDLVALTGSKRTIGLLRTVTSGQDAGHNDRIRTC